MPFAKPGVYTLLSTPNRYDGIGTVHRVFAKARGRRDGLCEEKNVEEGSTLHMLCKARLSLAAAVAALTIGIGASAADAVTLKMATDSGAKGSPAGDAIDTWAKMIEEGTDGEVEVEVFYQNQLGGQQEVFDLLVAGNVDIMLNWPLTSYDKRIGVLYTPYMVLSWDEALEAYKPGGWVNEMLDGIYKDMNLKFFGSWPEGFNGVATGDRYATTVDGADGLKVRTPPMFPFPQAMQALGYQTASIDWGEVFTAIQTGVVDGDAGNVIYWDYEYFRDVLDYYVRTKHMFVTGVLTMNRSSWNNLSADQQDVVRSAAVKIMQKRFKEAKAQDQMYVEKAKEAGMEYIEPSQSELEALAKKARAEVWPLMEDEIGSEIMDKIRENATKFE